ncbi:hypothetical protein K3M67_06835 [Sphingobium sp. V4]|uniref:hypothetical protein n=1 Tax=Sphingobium sp. V4 TaxID=3038927 RepID=UPI002557CA57|nr:hypothetical protein [Sphingobium sp. V4]WIW89664.1 hypothetical protein K3M67_06835 [Sphingobium sp. V4]
MPSIFVEADEPLLVFPDLKVAQRYLEAEDVRNGIYPRAFGPSGEQYSIDADGSRVIISLMDAPADAATLMALLKRSLTAVGEQPDDDATLPELVASAEAFWDERDPIGDRFSKPVPWWGCLLAVIAIGAMAAYILA